MERIMWQGAQAEPRSRAASGTESARTHGPGVLQLQETQFCQQPAYTWKWILSLSLQIRTQESRLTPWFCPHETQQNPSKAYPDFWPTEQWVNKWVLFSAPAILDNNIATSLISFCLSIWYYYYFYEQIDKCLLASLSFSLKQKVAYSCSSFFFT